MDNAYASSTEEKQIVPEPVRGFRTSARHGTSTSSSSLDVGGVLRTGVILRARRRRAVEEGLEVGCDDPYPSRRDATESAENVVAGRSSTGSRPGQTARPADGVEKVPKLRIVQRDRRARRRERTAREARIVLEEKPTTEEPATPTRDEEQADAPSEVTVDEVTSAERKPPGEERSRERRERRVQIREENSEREAEETTTTTTTEKVPEERTRRKRERRGQTRAEVLAEIGQDPVAEEIGRERRFPRREDDGSLENAAGIGFRTILSRRPGKPRRSSAGRRCPASSSTSSSSSVARRNPMTMDLQRLIDEVHARPAIWDQKNVNYHNRDVILKMWREIARACDVSTDVAKSKWKHLRDNFRNELKKTYRGKCDGSLIIGGASMASEHDSKWVWFKSLFFLRDQMNSRVIGCGLPQGCGPGIQSSPDETQIEPQIDILEGHEQAHFDEDMDGDGSCQSLLSNEDGGLHHRAGMPPPKSCKMSRKRQLVDAIDDDYAEIERKRYDPMQKRLATDQLEKDDTYHFLMSVRNPLKSLPLDRQMFVRLKIQELVYNEINSQNQYGRTYDSAMQDVKPPRTGPTGVNRNASTDDAVPIDVRNSTPEANSENAFFG